MDRNSIDNYTMECEKFISHIDELNPVLCVYKNIGKATIEIYITGIQYNVIHRDMELEVGQQLV